MSKRKFGHAEEPQIAALYESGKTIRQIADMYEITHTTSVRNALLRQGVKLRPRNSPRLSEDWKSCTCGGKVIYKGNGGMCARCYHHMHNMDPDVQDRRLTLRLQYNFKMSREEFDDLLKNQNNVCAICGNPDNRGFRLTVDHDHKCCQGSRTCGKCNRGLLCGKCNSALGLLGENKTIIGNMLSYLERFS